MELRTSKDCRDAYREILQGYSYVSEQSLYIKHFKEPDLGALDTLYKGCSEETSEIGLSSEKEQLKYLEEKEYWTLEEEQEYINAGLAVTDAFLFQEKLKDEKQRISFNETIEEQLKNLKKIDDQRRELVEPTIESYCEKRVNEHYVRFALFRDEELKEPMFSEEEFQNLSFRELAELVRTYNKAISKYKERNIKRIGVCYFFLNSFLMAENDPIKFYGKSVLDMTVYQQNLFSKGKFNKYILEEGKSPPESMYEMFETGGMDQVVSWFDNTHLQIQAERDRQKAQASAQNANQGRGAGFIRQG